MTGSYRDLFIWQASVDLAVRVLELLNDPSSRRKYILADQLTRAALSVPSNIAEGKGRLSLKEFRHFLGTARGSLYELKTQLEIATRAGCISEEARNELMREADKIAVGINKLLQRLNNLIAQELKTPSS